jgi:amino acid adenylation domain-containing protein
MIELQSVPPLFEQQAAANPAKIAVKAGDASISYGQLNREANRLAHAILAQLGHQPEPVTLLVEQGLQAIVAILGILKAGKTYVPLDPTFPQPRLAAIVADSQARLLVANDKNLELAGELCLEASLLINLDRLTPDLADHNPELAVEPERLLNIMYTSGSSGQPKGVVQTHRNLTYSLFAVDGGTRSDDRALLLHSHSFGVSAATIFGALLYGACLCLYDLRQQGLNRLGDWLEAEKITLYHSVPTVFRHFLNLVAPDKVFESMRMVKLGGEPVLKSDAALFRRHFPPTCQMRLTLGSTEAYAATYYFVDRERDYQELVLPIGKPVPGKEILLWNEQEQPVAAGEVGEICIKSDYISPGYWQKPELTQATFLPDPAGSGATIYRTGDLGRMRPDGNLEHLGRKDSQVKIRGHRVEVAEIEQALLEVEGVKQTAVVAHRVSHDLRLVGYVVPRDQVEIRPEILRQALLDRFPDYMVPSTFVLLESLPLLPFGKVNRQALPLPSWERPSLQTPYAAPRTPTEQKLVAIWQAILGLEQVGIYDNFFDLGGHSLLATQVIARANEAFGTNLTVSDIFNVNTIAELALVVTQKMAAAADEAALEEILLALEQSAEEQL